MLAPPWRVGAPSSGKSWIRHWLIQLNYREFVSTRLLVHKHVKISVDKWILETTLPYRHVTIFRVYFVSVFLSRMKLHTSFLQQCRRIDFSVDEWISKVIRPLYEWFKFLFYKPTTLEIMPLLASETLLHENQKFQQQKGTHSEY